MTTLIGIDILESNLLIAKFMGGKDSKTARLQLKEHEIWLPIHGVIRFDTIELGYGKILHYHNSWDWLMPAVEKIMATKYEDGETAYLRTFGMVNEETGNYMVRFNRHCVYEAKTFFEATYLAVVEFIKN